ncbi:unnamed protein product [Cunninghamella blakesleeana]
MNNTPKRSLSFHTKTLSQEDMDSISSSPRYRPMSYSPPPSLSNNNNPIQRSPLITKQKSETNLLSRQNSDISLYGATTTNNLTSDIPWTRKQWEVLEYWYDKRERNCQRASMSFYLHESLDKDTNIPKWSKEYILWRCQCLDTNTKYHHGVLPSERKKRRDKIKMNRKLDLNKKQQQERQDSSSLLDNDKNHHLNINHSFSRRTSFSNNSYSRKNSFNE